MSINSVNLSKNFSLKGICLSKEQKSQQIEKISLAIINVAREQNWKCVCGELKELYRFKAKIQQEVISFQWEAYFTGTQLSSGILRFKNEAYMLSIQEAREISRLIVGNQQSRESDFPDFLYPFLNGNAFEYIKLEKWPALAASYWNEWEKQKTLYREWVYPYCLSIIQKFVSNPTKKTFRFLEICGGDGEFATMVFNRMEASIESYSLIELNEESIKKAQTALSKEFESKRFSFFQENVVTATYEILLNNTNVDFVIGIGALVEQVLPSRTAALTTLKKAVEHLNSEGMILLTGLTSSWIISSDLENLGLKILNYSSPSRYRCSDIEQEFYIAQKTGSSKTELSWNFPSYEMNFVKPSWSGH